jgi:6-phosphogluconolactonase/glucosamine-6-phosphate isomerase/deaminase
MKSHITETPDKDAGEHISKLLREHRGEYVLLLLSGGSALNILSHIKTEHMSPSVTIAMADEHFTRDAAGNNFLQVTATPFYAASVEKGANFIPSVPGEYEKLHEFSARMRETFEKYLQEYPERFTIGVFGIGEDGHTAGIFPAPLDQFESIYKTDDFYIHVTQHTHAYSERTTVTPTLIEELVDEVILYAIGTNKCENILDYMYNRTFLQHEIPALIPASHPQSVLFTDCPTLTPEVV